MITEVHTSQLTASCLRRAQLTLEGKAVGFTTGALFVGNIVHAALRHLHEGDTDWKRTDCESAVIAGAAVAEQTATAARRPLSDAVLAGKAEHMAEALKLVYAYATRCRLPDGAKLIGCELPIRATWEVDGEPFDFASHLDMLWRDPRGRLLVRDWKSGSDSPSRMFLARNLQLAAYHLAVGTGEVCVGGDWLAFDTYPAVEWCQLRNLLPFGKATTTKDDAGKLTEYKKGDAHPLRSALLTVDYTDAGRDAAWAEIATRVRMMRADLWPTNPDAEGCRHCDCQPHCPSFDGFNLGGSHE